MPSQYSISLSRYWLCITSFAAKAVAAKDKVSAEANKAAVTFFMCFIIKSPPIYFFQSKIIRLEKNFSPCYNTFVPELFYKISRAACPWFALWHNFGIFLFSFSIYEVTAFYVNERGASLLPPPFHCFICFYLAYYNHQNPHKRCAVLNFKQ